MALGATLDENGPNLVLEKLDVGAGKILLSVRAPGRENRRYPKQPACTQSIPAREHVASFVSFLRPVVTANPWPIGLLPGADRLVVRRKTSGGWANPISGRNFFLENIKAYNL